MTFEQAKRRKDELESAYALHGAKLRTYPKTTMGLTPDNVRASTAWRTDKRLFDVAFASLRSFNRAFVKEYKKELRAERASRLAT